MEGTRRCSEFVNPKLSRRPTPIVLVGRPSSISLCSERSFARARVRANINPFAGSNIDVSETTTIINLVTSNQTTGDPSFDESGETTADQSMLMNRLTTKSSLRILPPLIETLPNTSLTGDQAKDNLPSQTSKLNTCHVKPVSAHPTDRKNTGRPNTIVCRKQTKPIKKGRGGAPRKARKASQSQRKPISRPAEKILGKKVVPPITKKKSLDIANVENGSKIIENQISSSSLSESSRDGRLSSSNGEPVSGSPDTKMREIPETFDDSDIPSVSARCSPISATLTNASDQVVGDESNSSKPLGDESNSSKPHAKFDVLPSLNRRKLRTASRIRSPSISDNISSRRLLKEDHQNEAGNRRFSIGEWNKQKAINLRRGSLRPCTEVEFIECQRTFATERYSSSNSKQKTSVPPTFSNTKSPNALCSNYLRAKNHSHNQAKSKSTKQLPPLRKTCKTTENNDMRSRKSRHQYIIQALANEEAADSSASKSVSIGSHSDSPCTSPSSPSLLIARPLTVFSTSVVTPVSSSTASQVITTALTPISSAAPALSIHALSPTQMSSSIRVQSPMNASCETVDELRASPSLSSPNVNTLLKSVSDLNKLSLLNEKEKEDLQVSKNVPSDVLNIDECDRSPNEYNRAMIHNETKINKIVSPAGLNGTHSPSKETREKTVNIANESKPVGVQDAELCAAGVPAVSPGGVQDAGPCAAGAPAASPVGDELSSLPDFYKHIQRRSSSIDSVMSRPGSDFLDVPLFPLQSRDRSPSSSTLDESESPTMSPSFNTSSNEGADLQQQVVHRLSDAIQLPCPTPCQTPDLESGAPGFLLSTPFLPKVVEQVAGPQVSLTTEDGDDFAVWFGRRGSIFIEEKASPGTMPGQSSSLIPRTTINQQGQVSLDVPKTIDNTRPL